MATRTITLFDPVLGLVSGSGDNQLTLIDADDRFFEHTDQNGNNQSALLDGAPVTVNSILSAVGPQLVIALVDGLSVSLNLVPVRITIEDGFFDDSYINFPDLPAGATILVGVSVPLVFPDPVAVPLCLAAATKVTTRNGAKKIGDIEIGDQVETVDAGWQTVRYVSKRKIDFLETPEMQKYRPIVIEPGALGNGLPRRRLSVSPQHCILISHWRSELLFGEREVLAPAKSLINGDTIRPDHTRKKITYCHILLDNHHLIKAEGVRVETLFLGDLASQTLCQESRAELLDIFPDLKFLKRSKAKRARPPLKSYEVVALAA